MWYRWEKIKIIQNKTKLFILQIICDECDIRHTCAKIGNKSGIYICDMLKEIEKELNIK